MKNDVYRLMAPSRPSFGKRISYIHSEERKLTLICQTEKSFFVTDWKVHYGYQVLNIDIFHFTTRGSVK